MSDSLTEVFAIKDTKSNKYLSNIWLAQDKKSVSLFATLDEAQNHLSRIRMGRFLAYGGTGFYARDLVIVRLGVYPIEEIK